MGMIINRRRVCGGESLPYDYKVKYLQSNEKAFIKIPYHANTNTVVETVFYDVITTPYALGTRTSMQQGGYFALGINSDSGTVKFVFNTHNNEFFAGYSEPSEVHIVCGDGKLIIDGLITTYQNPTFNSTNPFDIFCAATHPSGSAIGDLYCPFPIGRTTIKEHGLVLYDLIPVVKDNVGCMYDKVSGTFFYNAGTGNFIVGSRIS